jgi:hypothetical protein
MADLERRILVDMMPDDGSDVVISKKDRLAAMYGMDFANPFTSATRSTDMENHKTNSFAPLPVDDNGDEIAKPDLWLYVKMDKDRNPVGKPKTFGGTHSEFNDHMKNLLREKGCGTIYGFAKVDRAVELETPVVQHRL